MANVEKRAKAAAAMRRWRAKNPPHLLTEEQLVERRARATAATLRWRAKNKSKPLTETQLAQARIRQKRWRQRNPEKAKEKSLRDGKTAWLARPWTRCLGVRQAHAKKRGLPFTLKAADAKAVWTGKCAITGLPFDLREGEGPGPRAFSPSMDRIRPARGYIPGNIRFILQCVNAFRGTMTDKLMARVAACIVERVIHCK